MKKISFVAICSCVLLFLTACDNQGIGGYTRLSPPQNLRMIGNQVNWDYVVYADDYLIWSTAFDEQSTSGSNTFDLNTVLDSSTEGELYVKAISKDQKYQSSEDAHIHFSFISEDIPELKSIQISAKKIDDEKLEMVYKSIQETTTVYYFYIGRFLGTPISWTDAELFTMNETDLQFSYTTSVNQSFSYSTEQTKTHIETTKNTFGVDLGFNVGVSADFGVANASFSANTNYSYDWESTSTNEVSSSNEYLRSLSEIITTGKQVTFHMSQENGYTIGKLYQYVTFGMVDVFASVAVDYTSKEYVVSYNQFFNGLYKINALVESNEFGEFEYNTDYSLVFDLDKVSSLINWEGEAEQFNITYILNGGINNNNNPTSVYTGNKAITLQEPSKEGYEFGGWLPNNVIPENLTSDLTFEATWKLFSTNISMWEAEDNDAIGKTDNGEQLKQEAIGLDIDYLRSRGYRSVTFTVQIGIKITKPCHPEVHLYVDSSKVHSEKISYSQIGDEGKWHTLSFEYTMALGTMTTYSEIGFGFSLQGYQKNVFDWGNEWVRGATLVEVLLSK